MLLSFVFHCQMIIDGEQHSVLVGKSTNAKCLIVLTYLWFRQRNWIDFWALRSTPTLFLCLVDDDCGSPFVLSFFDFILLIAKRFKTKQTKRLRFCLIVPTAEIRHSVCF